MAVRSLRIDPSLDPNLVDFVRKAETTLERHLGDAANRVEVVWKPGNLDADLGPTATLELTDHEVTHRQEFTRREFDDDSALYWGLSRLWDGILKERLRIQQRRVYESLSDPEGE